MTEFDYIAYMEDIAIRMLDIQHTDSKAHFFRISGAGQMDQFLNEINYLQDPVICVDINPDGRVLAPQETNLVDTPSHRFYVMKKAGSGKFEDMENAKKESKTLGFKILAKFKHDKHQALYKNVDNGLHFLDLNFSYQVVGPLAQKWYGCMFTIRLQQSAYDAGMVYSEDDYSS